MNTFPKFLAVFAIGMTLMGCQTTGDPTQGGFWGWNEDKAKGRQQDLQNHANTATQNAANAEAQNAGLRAKKRAEEVEVRLLETQLSALQDENGRLEHELDSLRSRSGKVSNNLKAVLQKLDAGKKEIASLSKSQTSPNATTDIAESKKVIAQLDARNKQLQQAILLMTQR